MAFNIGLVPMLLRGNAYDDGKIICGMDSHGGPREPEYDLDSSDKE